MLRNAAALAMGVHYLHGDLKDRGRDNTLFLVLAESLAEGHGYPNVHLTVGADRDQVEAARAAGEQR